MVLLEINCKKLLKDNYKLDIDPEEARVKVNNYRANIKRIGMVNLAAIEEYERVNTRYVFLTNQREDLLKAEDTLLEIMNEMDEVMKEEFKITPIISVEMENVIRKCADIYAGIPEWVSDDGDIKTINFAKAVCSETARLTMLGTSIKIDGSARAEWLQEEIDKVCKLYASYCISYQELLYRLPQWKKVRPIKGNNHK